MADSVWFVHEILERVNDKEDTHGADRADLLTDLGLSGTFSKFDIIDSFIAWLPITLASEDAAGLDPVYLLSFTQRSEDKSLEYLAYPDTMSLEEAEALISPNKTL